MEKNVLTSYANYGWKKRSNIASPGKTRVWYGTLRGNGSW